MTIPSQHIVGDPGHTDDHNAIADVLTSQESRVAALEGLQPGYMVKTGGNAITLTNPSGFADQVIIPSGSRDDAAYVRTVSYGGVRTFGLDTYGQLRAGAAQDGTCPAEFHGRSETQTADLGRWRKGGASGAIVARVDSDGNVFAPNLTPTAWTNLSLASGVAWYDVVGARPQYRRVGDEVQLRGHVKRSNNADFATSPQEVGTLPGGFTPPHWAYSVQPSQFSSSTGYVRMEVRDTGAIYFYFSGGYTPGWVGLDGFRFSLTA